MNNNTILIGAGQAGCRLCESYRKLYDYGKEHTLIFNTAEDDIYKELILLKNQNNLCEGSGRNPIITLDTILPINEERITKYIKSVITPRIDTFLFFNSIGGGSGSSINYYILKNILPKIEEEQKISFHKISSIILPFKSEGNPANSNAAAMLNMYYSLSNEISIIPIENDTVYIEDNKSLFGKSNDIICDTIYKMLDYEYFIGTHKINGLGTLDKKEFERIIKPLNGFLGFSNIQLNHDFNDIKCVLNNFNMQTSKNIIIQFRTSKNNSIDLKILNKLHDTFKTQVKIICESENELKENEINILANGIEIPDFYKQKIEEINNDVNSYKDSKKESKKKNKAIIKTNSKKLFNI